MVSTALVNEPERADGRPFPPVASLTCRLVGGAAAFALEHRISNGVLVVGAMISLAATAMNGALGLPAALVAVTAVATVTYAALYLWSRGLRHFTAPAVLSFAGLAFGYYPLLWVYNCGLDGGIYYVGLIGLVATTCVFSGWHRAFFLGAFAAVTAALFVAELFEMLPVAKYQVRDDQFVDVFISFALGGAALVALVLVLRTSHQREHDKVVAFAELLATANRRLESALAQNEQLARTDPLTQLPNRLHLREVLPRRIREAARHGRPLSLVLFDIDHFKTINDDHGHNTGDLVLAELGRLLVRLLRSTDVPARWGGEEFVVLLPETPLDGAVTVAERIRQTVASHRFPGGIAVTVSLGVSTVCADDTEESFIGRADGAAYDAKRQGRNRALAR